VFCLQCGAEAPARAVTCAVCGHDLGRSSADLRPNAVMADTSLEAGVTRGTPVKDLPTSTRPALASVRIRAGDLDEPGLPQDATGRALLIVILALAADLFLPWSVVFGQHQTLPIGSGVAIACLLGLAALPLLHPRLRRYTATAAFPLVVGGMCLGIGIAFWANLGTTAAFVSFDCTGSCSPSVLPAESSAGPDFGLVAFLIGAVLVVVIGYHLFLGSARAYRPIASAAATIPTRPTELEPVQSHQAGQAAAATAVSADETTRTANPKAAPIPELVLPGSDSWNHTIEPPPILRPRAGSIRRSNR
jgi:ribosomal protein L40E